MKKEIKTFAVKFKLNGKLYEKLICAENASSAKKYYNNMFSNSYSDEDAISARKCTKNDIGQFFQGLKSI